MVRLGFKPKGWATRPYLIQIGQGRWGGYGDLSCMSMFGTVNCFAGGESVGSFTMAQLFGAGPGFSTVFPGFGNGGAGGNETIPPMYCDTTVIGTMNKAFAMTMNGMAPDHREASFFIKKRPDGSFLTTTPVSSFESMKNTVKWDYASIAFGHVHPNGGVPWPTPGVDTNLASRFHVPIFTFGSQGLWEFREGSKASVMLRPGISWQKPCK